MMGDESEVLTIKIHRSTWIALQAAKVSPYETYESVILRALFALRERNRNR